MPCRNEQTHLQTIDGDYISVYYTSLGEGLLRDSTHKNTANDVAQMGHVVDIREGRGDEDVLLALLGQDLVFGAVHSGSCALCSD